MKKLLIGALLLVAINANAQESELMSKEFWQENPDLTKVKTEQAKGFDFKDVHGSADPIFLSINSDAPVATIKYLIDQPGVDFTHTTVEGRIYLHIAAQKGNAEITDYLIQKGSDINFLDANGHTALTFAAFNGHLTTAVIDVFLKHGVDLQKKYKEKNGANLLLLAIGYDKDMTITNHLVAKGLSINSTDDTGNTAFDHAAKIGNIPLMKVLIQKGVKYSPDVLLIASQGTYRSANKIEVYQYLVEELKVSPFSRSKTGQNVLHNVTKKQNQTDVIQYFLAKGVDINQVDQDGNTPFISAGNGRSLEVMKAMIPKVKNINTLNANGESALLNAVKGSSGEIVALLLANGADLKVTDKEGHNLAYHLVDAYRPAGVRGGRGGRGAAPQGAGTPASPVQDDFTDKLKALQIKGLDLSIPQSDGNTLYHLAVVKNDLAILQKIAALQIDINAKNKEGITALHKSALISKDDTILKYLLSIGAKKDMLTGFEESAYDLAKENEFLTKANVPLEFLK